MQKCYRIGELNFRTNRRGESIKKYGGTDCHVKICSGEDSYVHVKDCLGYTARLGAADNEYTLLRYLKQLNEERRKK